MRVAIAADHAGFDLKQALVPYLREQGYVVTDLGTSSTEPVDYPDFGIKVANKVPVKAYAFDLRDVKLLDSPFKHAMELDQKYLLSLDTDQPDANPEQQRVELSP